MEFVESRTGKTVFARFFEGEDLLETVTRVADKTNVSSGFFFLIGTLKFAKMGFFREGKYETIEMDQPLEIVSCTGNVSIRQKKVFAHAHIAVSDDKGRVFGGHVMPGCLIGGTGELVLVSALGIKLFRKLDKKTNLALLSFSKVSIERRKKRSTPV
jgi:predicted DNA-binding protein with PD1-like motif